MTIEDAFAALGKLGYKRIVMHQLCDGWWHAEAINDDVADPLVAISEYSSLAVVKVANAAILLSMDSLDKMEVQ